jgi:hypothetical protein
MATRTSAIELELHDQIGQFYADPLGFVKFAYPWGEPGPLERYAGPDDWQRDYLIELGEYVKARKFDGKTPVLPIRMTTASGHGIGKSVLVAFLVGWIMSTRRNSKGTVTANTYQQLSVRTWATIQTWMKRSITAHWFEITNQILYRKNYKDSWYCQAQSCKEENSDAFAGQHAADSTSFYIFDEASSIPTKIYEVAEGGLSDGEPMFFAFGNPTRSQGEFHRITFGESRNRWSARSIDSRNCAFSNKELIKEWIEDRGEDSDFVRVRVKGIPPRASDSQFIDMDRITQAQKREVFALPDEPLIAGVDLAWGGADSNVVRFRRGSDARSIKPVVIPGESTRDASVMVVKLAELLNETFDGRKIHTMFIDSAGISGAVGSRLRDLGYPNIIEINFGADSPDLKYAYMRDYMWGKMKEWLLTGGIDADARLEVDLSGPGYTLDNKIRVKLESKKDMKKRGLDSPDHADALGLTFARPVSVPTPRIAEPGPPQRIGVWS